MPISPTPEDEQVEAFSVKTIYYTGTGTIQKVTGRVYVEPDGTELLARGTGFDVEFHRPGQWFREEAEAVAMANHLLKQHVKVLEAEVARLKRVAYVMGTPYVVEAP